MGGSPHCSESLYGCFKLGGTLFPLRESLLLLYTDDVRSHWDAGLSSLTSLTNITMDWLSQTTRYLNSDLKLFRFCPGEPCLIKTVLLKVENKVGPNSNSELSCIKSVCRLLYPRLRICIRSKSTSTG